MKPVCPQDYICTFTPVHPRTLYHTVGPWWQHAAGAIVVVVTVVVLAIFLIWVVSVVADARRSVRQRGEREREMERQRAHELAMEEQRTYQADMAKGDPEMLKLIRGIK